MNYRWACRAAVSASCNVSPPTAGSPESEGNAPPATGRTPDDDGNDGFFTACATGAAAAGKRCSSMLTAAGVGWIAALGAGFDDSTISFTGVTTSVSDLTSTAASIATAASSGAGSENAEYVAAEPIDGSSVASGDQVDAHVGSIVAGSGGLPVGATGVNSVTVFFGASGLGASTASCFGLAGAE
jgi:hypothetical protein